MRTMQEKIFNTFFGDSLVTPTIKDLQKAKKEEDVTKLIQTLEKELKHTRYFIFKDTKRILTGEE